MEINLCVLLPMHLNVHNLGSNLLVQDVDAMNYFRAFLDKNELSGRSLEVTTRVIELSSANYTAWYFRRLVLKHLNADLRPELDFVSGMSR
jgi:hypothetical protein